MCRFILSVYIKSVFIRKFYYYRGDYLVVLLVDDEELQLLRLEASVKRIMPTAKILSYTNPVKALEENGNGKIDIAFLDIEMPVLNGLQLAKRLKAINPLINVIFVTAYSDYAVSAYELHASGYVLKPVKDEKVRAEIDALRYPVNFKLSKKIYVQCFGNFEIFYDGVPLKFKRSKTKELFAYLIDRNGAVINVNELNAILWEEDHKSYLRVLIADLTATLKSVDCEDVFVKRFNGYCIDIDKVDCDAYEYKRNNPAAIRMYRGEYMIQYSWAVFSE